MNKKTILIYISFAIMMVGLGCSDALRGVFAPIFQSHFALNASKLSIIITISYLGNFCFMMLGSNLADNFGVRRVFMTSMILWMAAMGVYLVTDSYYFLLIGVFFAMGSSTLLNMLLNIMSPILFAMPAMIVNTLFFVQGIGTTFAQGIVGRFASEFFHWKLINGIMIVMGIISFVLFMTMTKNESGLKKSEKKKKQKKSGGYADIIKNPVFILFVLIFGFYFVAEHGVMNWMNIYCQEALSMSAAQASLIPTLFFGGIMVGRLVLAPLVNKLGIQKSLLYCLLVGTCIFVLTMILKGNALYLMVLAGFGFSIIYPTMTICIQLYFNEDIMTTASGTILAVATLFDIAFNSIFGVIIDSIGYNLGMLLLPISAIACLLLYFFMIQKHKPIRTIEGN